MGLATVWSRENLLLSWRRLTTGRNVAYKRYFRRLYYAYEVALDANLRDLHERLTAGSFRAEQPTRIYLPKPSGLQRPITLLLTEDQIVLQAMANVFADKVNARRRRLELTSVFSNIVQGGHNCVFSLQDWRSSYCMFQDKVREYFGAGCSWIAHFDLAAYYDTICHDMLLRVAFPRANHPNKRLILDCLKTWSSEAAVACHGHGIPQGPIASDFLAECFLLPVDEALRKQRIRFVRYVDDIRLFARSEDALREAAIHMEILLRERGLIPQGKKHAITHATSVEEAMGILPSIEPRDDRDGSTEECLPDGKALARFRSALSGRPLAIADKARARYVLFHAAPSKQLLSYVLRLMPRHPEHTDAFVQYIGRHGRSRSALRVCLALAKRSPYEYVRGEMWHLMALMMGPLEVRQAMGLARRSMKCGQAGLAVRWGVLHFLCAADRHGMGSCLRYVVRQNNDLLLALLAPMVPDRGFAHGRVAEKMLRARAFEPGIALAEQFVRLRLNYATVGVGVRDLRSQVRNTFRSLGLDPHGPALVDPMGEILQRRYSLHLWDGWRHLMGGEYSHALQLLSIADATFHIGRSQWLSYQNSFNHALFLAFQTWLQGKSLQGVVKTVGRNGKAVKFGTLVDGNQPFARAFPIVASGFSQANARRNALPGSHPYEESGQRTRHLKKKEQATITAALAHAYAEVIRVVSAHP